MDERHDEGVEADADDPLRALFTGKRSWPRLRCDVQASAQGQRTTYGGRLLDISRKGALLLIEDATFYAGGGDGVERMLATFPDGLEVVLPREGLRVPASIVRVVPHEEERLAVGCSFWRELTATEAVLLGTRAIEHELEEAAVDPLPRTPSSPVALSVALAPADGADGDGPTFHGRVRGAGVRTVDAVSAALGPADLVARRLAGRPLAVTFRVGRRRLAEGTGELVRCGPDDEGKRPVVRVVLDEPVPEEAAEHLAPAPEGDGDAP